MVAPIPSQITAILATIVDPYLGQDLVCAKVIQEIAISEYTLGLRLQFPYPLAQRLDALKQSIVTALESNWPDYTISLNIHTRVRRHRVQSGLKPKSSIKNIIAVASGKGGVGKSTVAVNLALALKAQGAKVALLDADIYGPSQPRMLGKQGQMARTQGKKLIPMESFGIQSVSIGYLVDEQAPMVWRGPMASGALTQLVEDTLWADCDYLIVDLPPGTGDIQLTLAQKIPISGVVVVTTPQDIALLDAQKAVKMFEKVGVPILGLVENMSTHICSSCGHQEAIFGSGGAQQMANTFNLPVFAQLPLDGAIRAHSDAGTPIVVSEPQGTVAAQFFEMALKMSATLAQREVDLTATLPGVVLEA